MVDKIKKFLKKLSPDLKNRIKSVLHDIQSGNIGHLDIQKLQGSQGLYRVRISSIRIVYRVSPDHQHYDILDIEYRGTIYKNL